jgi:TolA-binding protein
MSEESNSSKRDVSTNTTEPITQIDNELNEVKMLEQRLAELDGRITYLEETIERLHRIVSKLKEILYRNDLF